MQAKPALGGTRLRLVTFLVTGALFMEVLDGTIIATALPQMAQSFGTSAVALNVGISAYLLALGIFIPVSGWIADRFGARRVFSAAIAVFTLASAACGLIENFGAFVGLRVLQGASGAMMVPVGRLLVLRHTPQQGLMAAMSGLVWPALVAPAIGPPLGGFITAHASWHWIFFLNVPLGIGAFGAALALIPRMVPEERRPFDWTGSLLCSLGTFALLTGFEHFAAVPDAIGVALIVAGLALTVVARAHFRRARRPMLDLSPFRIETFSVALIGGSISRMAIGATPFLLPLMFQVGFGFDAFRSGLLLLVVFAGNLAMKAVTTPILRKFGYRPVMIWNGVLAAISLAACAVLQPNTPSAVTILVLLANGMTRSMQFTSLGTIAFADVSKERMADANGLFNTISQIVMAAGITFGAMGVRLGKLLAGSLQTGVPGAEYKLAFLLAPGVALLGLIDMIRLPEGAGDHFVRQAQRRP